MLTDQRMKTNVIIIIITYIIKLFLTQKIDSKLSDPDLDFLPIPDHGYRGQNGTGSRIRIRNTACIVKLAGFLRDRGRNLKKDFSDIYFSLKFFT
jgi:hypothetical protein